MYPNKNYIEKPINLLYFDSLGHAILNPQSLQFLQQIPRPISILSIAGPFRTGKSFLLNSLIAPTSSSGVDHFQVGSTTRSCTKGLWIWGKPVLSVDGDGKITHVVVIDTEGFGSCEQQFDKRIIILALLLSNCFIYNSKGLIDKDSIKDLQYVIQQTKKVKRQLCFDSITDFHWILRDFHYQLVNQLGLQISSDQYMQNCLKQYQASNQSCQLTKILNSFFRNRSCHTLITPQTNPCAEQNPQFTQQMIKLKKVMNGIPSINLDGPMLTQILQAYISAMNQNLAPNGVYREGAECRMRIICLSQLCKQLQAISQEQQPEKKAKLLKLILHEVQDCYISKMTSEKQIKMLKQQINIIISQFEGFNSTPQTCKNIKTRQPRPSIGLLRQRQPRAVSTQLDQFMSEKQIRSFNKIQISAIQRIRQQLQAKIYRYQLEIQQLGTQLTQLQTTNKELNLKNLTLEEQLNQLSEQKILIQKKYTISTLQFQQLIQNIKQQKLNECSQLQKSNRLLQQKTQYLQAKIVEMQMHGIENKQGLASKYKQQIVYLQKQNKQMLEKHTKQIDTLKQIYKNDENKLQSESSSINQLEKIGSEIKAYTQKISALQQQNSNLLILKFHNQNLIFGLQTQNKQLKVELQVQAELFAKKYKQIQDNLREIHQSQISTKQKMIKQLQIRYEQQKQNYKNEVEALKKKNEQQLTQHQQITANLQLDVRNLQQQCVQLCQKCQIQQSLRTDKEREIKLMAMQIETLRLQMSQNYDKYYQQLKQLRQENLSFKQQVQGIWKQKNELKQVEQQLNKQMQNQKQQYQGYQSQLKHMHSVQLARLQNKINSLTASNNSLKQIAIKYDQLNLSFAHFQEDKYALENQLKSKCTQISNLQQKIKLIQTQKQKLDYVIREISKQMQGNREQMQGVNGIITSKLQQKQQKFIQTLNKLHEKQKQCYLLAQKMDQIKKQCEQRQKELRKNMNDKIQQKNGQIIRLSRQLQANANLVCQSHQQALKLNQQLCLANQNRCFLEQSQQKMVENFREKQERDNQKYELVVKQLEGQLKKIEEQKKEIQRLLKIFENDSRQSCQNITDMRKKHSKQVQQYEAGLKLMRNKLIEVEQQNSFLKQNFKKTSKKLKYIQQSKELLENNYNQDFKIWCSKIETLENKQRRLSN